MLIILTKNSKKFEQFSEITNRLGITIKLPDVEIPEIQAHDFENAVSYKAFFVYQKYGPGYMIDDSGLILDAYPNFPGPITSMVCNGLGYQGMERLLNGVSNRAKMVCYIGCWVHDKLWYWVGNVTGKLVLKPPLDKRVPLSDWFIPDEISEDGVLLHRKRALDALSVDLEKLHEAIQATGD
jgi:inosine/xanthosine triphosphate pyrophosphatase family protein